ncbi:hypothetical protein AB4Z21_26300 [Paenibacillus sp. MCAF20]
MTKRNVYQAFEVKGLAVTEIGIYVANDMEGTQSSAVCDSGANVSDVLIREVTDPEAVIKALNSEIDVLEELVSEYEDEEEDEFDIYVVDGVQYGGEDLSIPIAKSCSKCRILKPLDAFYEQADGKYGRRADCINCKRSSVASAV